MWSVFFLIISQNKCVLLPGFNLSSNFVFFSMLAYILKLKANVLLHEARLHVQGGAQS